MIKTIEVTKVPKQQKLLDQKPTKKIYLFKNLLKLMIV